MRQSKARSVNSNRSQIDIQIKQNVAEEKKDEKQGMIRKKNIKWQT